MKILDRSWKSVFRTVKAWKNSKFNGRPKPPGYKRKNGEFILVFTNQQVKIKDNFLLFSKKVSLRLKTRLRDKDNIREVWIIPKGGDMW